MMDDLKLMIWNKTWIPKGYWRAVFCNSSHKAIDCLLGTLWASLFQGLGHSWVLRIINSHGTRYLFKVAKMTLVRQNTGLYLASNCLSEFTNFPNSTKFSQKLANYFFLTCSLSFLPYLPWKLSSTLSNYLIHANLLLLTHECHWSASLIAGVYFSGGWGKEREKPTFFESLLLSQCSK